MNSYKFNFDSISTIEQFYKIFAEKLNLSEHFGANLDALWDVITGEIELPFEIIFEKMQLEQLLEFEEIIRLLEEASIEMEGVFFFSYFIEKEDNNFGEE